jgi:thymidylate synthase (FAD)
MSIRLVWATPDSDKVIGYCARVSNPSNQDNEDVERLLKYCATHNHWSVFEMASAVIEINTTRDIARQILRHRSFSFQEFSQRYATIEPLGEPPMREARLQDHKNRQNSIEVSDNALTAAWNQKQHEIVAATNDAYSWALANGIAKEQARAVLPEGLTMSRMYMSGTMRSWVTYLQTRLDTSTQKEHREVAQCILNTLRPVAPITMSAFF